MRLKSFTSKIAAALIFAGALVLFNRVMRTSTRSPDQIEFESWLLDMEPQLADAAPARGPDISVALTFPGSTQRLDVSAKNSAPQALRLLQLVREGNLLSLGIPRPPSDASTPPAATDVALLITSPKHTFLSWINAGHLSGIPQGQLLLKLTQLFADEQRLALSRNRTE